MNDRRAFIKKVGRGAVALGLAGISGYLLLRESSGEDCSFDLACGGCRKNASCTHPQAKDFRSSGSERETNR